MRVAYADPPYFGCGKRLYGDQHPEAAAWDDRVTHAKLAQQLLDEYPDGWALSCNPSDLRFYLPLFPESVRVAAWCKTWHRMRPLVSVQYSWEPVIFSGGRAIKRRNPFIRDWVKASITMNITVKGAKPDEFCYWIFQMLGLQPDDEFHDLFPGSGAVTSAWNTYKNQPSFFDHQVACGNFDAPEML